MIWKIVKYVFAVAVFIAIELSVMEFVKYCESLK